MPTQRRTLTLKNAFGDTGPVQTEGCNGSVWRGAETNRAPVKMFSFSMEALSVATITEASSETTSASNTTSELESLDDVVFALFLECRDGPVAGASAAENALASLIKTFQPSPSMAHVELFIADGKGDPHFATYIGRHAGWGFTFGDNQGDFYMNANAGLWRALPIRAKNAAAKLRTELGWHVDTPYSLARYCCSVPPMRSLAGLLSDGVGAPAHCAALTARCLKRALKSESPVSHSPPWYGPSTLLIELSQAHNVQSAQSECDDKVALSVDTLLHGSADSIGALAADDKKAALLHLSNRAAREAVMGDQVAAKVAQKQLATGLLRSVYG